MKRCTQCRTERPLSDFYADRRRRDGLQSHCKDCANRVRAVRIPQAALKDRRALVRLQREISVLSMLARRLERVAMKEARRGK